jgi:predicted nuclease with TOPRIM domain
MDRKRMMDLIARNIIEKDLIEVEIKRAIDEANEMEGINDTIQQRLKAVMKDNEQLENTLSHLKSQLAALEKRSSEHEQEKDELSNKVILSTQSFMFITC